MKKSQIGSPYCNKTRSTSIKPESQLVDWVCRSQILTKSIIRIKKVLHWTNALERLKGLQPTTNRSSSRSQVGPARNHQLKLIQFSFPKKNLCSFPQPALSIKIIVKKKKHPRLHQNILTSTKTWLKNLLGYFVNFIFFIFFLYLYSRLNVIWFVNICPVCTSNNLADLSIMCRCENLKIIIKFFYSDFFMMYL